MKRQAARPCSTRRPSGSVSQVLFRRSVFEELDGFDRRIRRDDHDLWLRVLKRYRILSVDRDLVCRYVERSTLRRSHRVIDVVGYLQLYSKHKELYDKNPQAKLALFEKIAACYRAAHSVPDWLRFAAKVRLLRWRLSGSAAHAAAVLPPPGEPGGEQADTGGPAPAPVRLPPHGRRSPLARGAGRRSRACDGGGSSSRCARSSAGEREEDRPRRRQEQAGRELELAGRESKADARAGRAGRPPPSARRANAGRSWNASRRGRRRSPASRSCLSSWLRAQRQRGAQP